MTFSSKWGLAYERAHQTGPGPCWRGARRARSAHVESWFHVSGGGSVSPITRNVIGDIVAYVMGCAAAGGVLGGFWMLCRTTAGAFLLGYLAAAVMFGVLGWRVDTPQSTADLTEFLLRVALMTLIFGTGFAVVISKGEARRRR